MNSPPEPVEFHVRIPAVQFGHSVTVRGANPQVVQRPHPAKPREHLVQSNRIRIQDQADPRKPGPLADLLESTPESQ